MFNLIFTRVVKLFTKNQLCLFFFDYETNVAQKTFKRGAVSVNFCTYGKAIMVSTTSPDQWI